MKRKNYINNMNTQKNKPKNSNDNDSSFNQLLALQLLIQKHSGLKELCKI